MKHFFKRCTINTNTAGVKVPPPWPADNSNGYQGGTCVCDGLCVWGASVILTDKMKLNNVKCALLSYLVFFFSFITQQFKRG